MIKIFDTEIDFDFADADCIERIENQYSETEKELNEINWNDEKKSECVRAFCKAIFNFFDKVFGEGISEKLFKGKYNYQKCLQSFKYVLDEKTKQDNEIDDEIKYLANYSPDRVKRN